MQMNKKKLLSLVLAIAMTLSLAMPGAFAAEETTPVAPYTIGDVKDKLVILHTNDTHGADVAVAGKSIGTAGVAQLKKDFEAAGAKVLLVSAGDAIQGQPLVSLSKGASAIEFMNAAGYDLMVPGNHEMDYGYENLKTILKDAKFKVIAANILGSDKKPVFDASFVAEKGGVKIGFFGLATPETLTKADATKMKGLDFPQGKDLYALAQKQVDALIKEKVDLVVCLAHLGVDEESATAGNRSVDLVNNVKGIDLVIDGHSHTEMKDGKPVKAETYPSFKNESSTVITSTGTALANVGVVVYDKTGDTFTTGLISAKEYSKVDEKVAKLVNDKNAAVDKELSVVIGKTEVELNGAKAPGNRTEETNLGDFAADALLWSARKTFGEDKVDAALTNGGGIRAKIEAGDISMKTMKTVFPFGNTVATVKVTGAQLLEALEAATFCTPEAVGAFPQVSGIHFTVNTAVTYEQGAQYPMSTYYAPAKPGSRVEILSVNGKAFDAKALYTIATNDFTAKGNDTYGVFKTANTANAWADTAMPLEDALTAYVKEVLKGTIPADRYGKTQNRITVLSGDITPGIWYEEAAHAMLLNGTMKGVGDNKFAAAATVTRATVYQMLFNMEGAPTKDVKASQFTDLANQWYVPAANWAVSVKLLDDSDKRFAGDEVLTRGELAKIIADYAAMKKITVATEGKAMKEAPDYATIPAQYLDGMTFCFYGKVMTGDQTGKLNPMGNLTRGELAQVMLNFSKVKPAKSYNFNPEKPYDGVKVGLFNNVAIATDKVSGVATYYLPQGLQPWTPAVIVLTPDNTTAEAFAAGEIGLAWRAVADAKKIGLTFLEPMDGKTWNLTLDKAGRDDGAVLNQLFMTMRSKSVKNPAPFSMDKSHTTLVGYQEGGAAALLFGAQNATDFSGICAVNASEIPAKSLSTVGEQLVLPFPGDGTKGVTEMNVKAKTVDMPVWFVNSAAKNKTALDYYIAANGAKAAKANDHAEATYQAANSDARIWVSAKDQTPDTIYSAFLGTTKRFMAMQEGGRVAFANDFTKPQYKIHEEQVNGELRRWTTYVPTSYTGKTEVPLVLVMHGYTASMYAIAEESRWYDVAEKNGFIVVFAQGLVRPADAMGNIPAAIWCTGSFAGMVEGVDPMVDVKFINTLLDKTEAEYKIDSSRVYATGHSNGSMMTWEMGVRATERFAAIAPIGAISAPGAEFSAKALLPTWAMVGEFDSAAKSEMVEGQANVDTLKAWNTHNGVDEKKVSHSKQYGDKWETTTFSNQQNVPLVRFTTVMGTPHVYLQEQSETLWTDFFSKYTRGKDGALYYQGKLVQADTYAPAAGWYTAAPAASK